MKLAFVYLPVMDLGEALAFYRDVLGLEETWRMGDTVGLRLPGTEVSLLLDQEKSERRAGPFFVVDDASRFYEENKTRLKFIEGPRQIPPGMLVLFEDPSGNVIRVMDSSRDDSQSEDH